MIRVLPSRLASSEASRIGEKVSTDKLSRCVKRWADVCPRLATVAIPGHYATRDEDWELHTVG